MNFVIDLVLVLYNLFGHNLGLTIIFIGVLSRVVVWPLTQANLKHTKKMQEIKPHLDELKKKHGSDRKKFTEAQMKLFKDMNINPAAGCLPLIVQIVVLIFVYQVVSQLINKGLNASFLFWDLGHPDTFKVAGIPIGLPGILVLLAAIGSLVQAKMMLPEPVKVYKEDTGKEKNEKEDFSDAMASAQSQMLFLSPLLIAYFGTTFPAGLSLYWFVTTAIAIFQQYLVNGWGGLNPWLRVLKLVK